MVKYSKTHEWVNLEGEKAKVGISVYASEELGDIVYVSLPEVGDEVVAGETLCEVESVKAVSEIMSPVNGTIVAVNEDLEDAPESINEDALNAWIAEIEISEQPVNLMSEEEYNNFVG